MKHAIIFIGKGISRAVDPNHSRQLMFVATWEGGGSMISTYECLSLMIAFAILIIEIIRNNDDKQKK